MARTFIKSVWESTFGSVQGWSLCFFAIVCHVVPYLVDQRRNIPNYSGELDYRFRTSYEQYVPNLYNWIINISIVFIILIISHLICGDVNNYKIIHGSISSYSVTTLFVSIVKRFVGAPRPYFFSQCKWNGTECEKSPADLSFQSFPSGHTADSFALLGFISFYLLGILYRIKQYHFKKQQSSNNNSINNINHKSCFKFHILSFYQPNIEADIEDWLTLLSLIPVGIAGLVASSRICDYSHHPCDVLAGSCVGLSVSYLFHNKYFDTYQDDNQALHDVSYIWHYIFNRDQVLNNETGVDGSSSGIHHFNTIPSSSSHIQSELENNVDEYDQKTNINELLLEPLPSEI